MENLEDFMARLYAIRFHERIPYNAFPHLALGRGWQTTLTYASSSTQNVFADSGAPLVVSFGGTAASSRSSAGVFGLASSGTGKRHAAFDRPLSGGRS
jgi:hypothetical protein